MKYPKNAEIHWSGVLKDKKRRQNCMFLLNFDKPCKKECRFGFWLNSMNIVLQLIGAPTPHNCSPPFVLRCDCLFCFYLLCSSDFCSSLCRCNFIRSL